MYHSYSKATISSAIVQWAKQRTLCTYEAISKRTRSILTFFLVKCLFHLFVMVAVYNSNIFSQSLTFCMHLKHQEGVEMFYDVCDLCICISTRGHTACAVASETITPDHLSLCWLWLKGDICSPH